MIKQDKVAFITKAIGKNFRCFGGDACRVQGNPIAEALKDEPLSFAATVDVASVVKFVLEASEFLEQGQ